jgi:hypothetical protein
MAAQYRKCIARGCCGDGDDFSGDSVIYVSNVNLYDNGELDAVYDDPNDDDASDGNASDASDDA